MGRVGVLIFLCALGCGASEAATPDPVFAGLMATGGEGRADGINAVRRRHAALLQENDGDATAEDVVEFRSAAVTALNRSFEAYRDVEVLNLLTELGDEAGLSTALVAVELSDEHASAAKAFLREVELSDAQRLRAVEALSEGLVAEELRPGMPGHAVEVDQSEPPRLRRRIEALVAIDGPESLAVLTAAMNRTHSVESDAIAEAVLGERERMPRGVRRIGNGEAMRGFIAWQLAQRGDPAAIPALLQAVIGLRQEGALLMDAKYLNSVAMRALGEFGENAVDGTLAFGRGEGVDVQELRSRRGGSAASVASTLRTHATKVMGYLAGERAWAHLVAEVGSGEESRSLPAARAMLRFLQPDRSVVIAAMEAEYRRMHPNTSGRETFTDLLVSLAGESSLGLLRQSMLDEENIQSDRSRARRAYLLLAVADELDGTGVPDDHVIRECDRDIACYWRNAAEATNGNGWAKRKAIAMTLRLATEDDVERWVPQLWDVAMEQGRESQNALLALNWLGARQGRCSAALGSRLNGELPSWGPGDGRVEVTMGWGRPNELWRLDLPDPLEELRSAHTRFCGESAQ